MCLRLIVWIYVVYDTCAQCCVKWVEIVFRGSWTVCFIRIPTFDNLMLEKAKLISWRDSSPKNVCSVVIYLPSFGSCVTFYCRTHKKKIWRMFQCFFSYNESQWGQITIRPLLFCLTVINKITLRHFSKYLVLWNTFQYDRSNDDRI